MIRLRSTTGSYLIALAWVMTQAILAHAQQRSPQQVVEDLNREGMEAYNALDINKAGSTLEEAWRVATQGGVPPQLVARTSLNLGVVYVGGLGDQNSGLNYFVQAVCIDPNIQLDPLTSTPDIMNVFNGAMQRARGGGCPTGGGAPPGPAPAPGPVPYVAPQPVAPPPDQALVHSSPPEQLSQTPLPLYVEVSPLAQAKKIFLYYKGLGMTEFKQAPMYRFQNGFAYQLSCSDVWEPKVSYYIEAKSADGRLVGVIGSAAQPIEVPIVAARKQAEPTLPGAQSPMSCVSKECPPGVQGCKQKGKIGIGDACSADGDCQSGLECRDDVCLLIGAGGTEVPTYNPTTGTYDQAAGPESKPGEKPSPNFVQLGLTVGLAYVQAGMVADRPPTDSSHLFVDTAGNFIADPAAAAAQNQVLNFPQPGTTTAGKLTAWVPDADSGDTAGPLQGNCSADGKPSGPGMANLLPTKYCVRVKSPGFVPNLALRAAIGRFFTPKIALAALLRFQFAAGEGALSHMLIGARAEYLLTEPRVKALMISGFAGATFGEIQASPSAPAPNKNAPFVKSGLMGIHAGANFRYRFSPHFGLYASPELDVQLPTFLLNLDFTLAGIEAAF